MLVNFMVIGAQKSGTTSLANQLAKHRNICFCRTKEPGYFHKTEDWRSGLNDYHALFNPAPGQLCGEASTFYTFFPEWQGTAKRLHQYNSALKLIYLMRQPVERVISHYTHNFVRNIDQRSPIEAIAQDTAYINRSRYAVQLRRYLEHFELDNMLLLTFEEFVADQQATLQKIASFLQITPNDFEEVAEATSHQSVGEAYLKYGAIRRIAKKDSFQAVRPYIPTAIRRPIRNLFSNKLSEKPHFSAELKQLIWQLVEDDVYAVENIMGRRLEMWHEGYVA